LLALLIVGGGPMGCVTGVLTCRTSCSGDSLVWG